MITNVRDVRGENIDWISLGHRFKKFRKARRMSQNEAAQEIGLTDEAIADFESGYSSDRKSVGIIWNISLTWNLSVNWLLNGIGNPHDPDPLSLMPDTLHTEKQVGIRKTSTRLESEEGSYTDYILEFVMAIDKFKIKHNVPFPKLTQIYEIMIALGYRKSVPARIAPLGYIIEHQKWAEKLRRLEKIALEITEEEKAEAKAQKRVAREREKKQNRFKKATAPPKFLFDPTLSQQERSRRLKVSKFHRGKTKIKRFLITDPDGRQYTTERGLNDFCREHGLCSNNMGAVANGRRKHAMGWKVQHIPQIPKEPDGQD